MRLVRPEVEALLLLGQRLLDHPVDVGVEMWDGWAGSLHATFRAHGPDIEPLIDPVELLGAIERGGCPGGVAAAAAISVYGPRDLRARARSLADRLIAGGAVLPRSIRRLGRVEPVEAVLLGDVWGDSFTLVVDCVGDGGRREGSQVAIEVIGGVRAVRFVLGPTIESCRSEAFRSDYAVATDISLADARALFEVAAASSDQLAAPAVNNLPRLDGKPLARFGSGPVEVSLTGPGPVDLDLAGLGAVDLDLAGLGASPERAAPGQDPHGAGTDPGGDAPGDGALTVTVEVAEADRAVVEQRFSLLPEGGRSPLPRPLAGHERVPELLAVEFAASGWPMAALGPFEGLSSLAVTDFVESICRFARLCDGDPLRWSPDRVRTYLRSSLLPHSLATGRQRKLPALLKAWLGFAAERRGVPPRALAVSQRTVDLVCKQLDDAAGS